MCYKLETR